MTRRPCDMRFYQDLGTPRPTHAPCTRGYCGPSSVGHPQPRTPYPYNPGPYVHGPPTYYPWPGPSGQPTGAYGQAYYGQLARRHSPQLVPSDQHGWPVRQEEDWGEAVVYCPRKAPCFQRGTHHCQALLGQKTPHGRAVTPAPAQKGAPAPQKEAPPPPLPAAVPAPAAPAVIGWPQAPDDGQVVSTKDTQASPSDEESMDVVSCGSSIESMDAESQGEPLSDMDAESQGEPLSDMEVDPPSVPMTQPRAAMAAPQGQATCVQAAGISQQRSKRKRNNRAKPQGPQSKRHQAAAGLGPNATQGAPVPVPAMQLPSAPKPVPPNVPGPSGTQGGPVPKSAFQFAPPRQLGPPNMQGLSGRQGGTAFHFAPPRQLVPPKAPGPSGTQGAPVPAPATQIPQVAHPVPRYVPAPQQGLKSGATQQGWYQRPVVAPATVKPRPAAQQGSASGATRLMWYQQPLVAAPKQVPPAGHPVPRYVPAPQQGLKSGATQQGWYKRPLVAPATFKPKPAAQQGSASGATRLMWYQQPLVAAPKQVPPAGHPVPPYVPAPPQGSKRSATQHAQYQQPLINHANQVPPAWHRVPPHVTQQGSSGGATQPVWHQRSLVAPGGQQRQGAPPRKLRR